MRLRASYLTFLNLFFSTHVPFVSTVLQLDIVVIDTYILCVLIYNRY